MEPLTQGGLFLNFLKDLKVHQQALLEVLKTEKSALVNLKSDTIQEITQEKQRLLDQIDHLEQERKAWTENFAKTQGEPVEAITLSFLRLFFEREDPGLGEQVAVLYGELSLLLSEILSRNHENKALIESFLKTLSDLKANLFREKDRTRETYNARGNIVGRLWG